MAFDYFAEEKVDIAVIETGLGGRLDSTNIITPLLSIITNIGLDHQDILGNSLEEIATEKAGIIKPGVPVIIGESNQKTLPVFINKATENNAKLVLAADKYQVISMRQKPFSLNLEIQNHQNGETTFISSDLNGIYQQKNIVTVLSAMDEINGLGFILSKKKRNNSSPKS